MSSSKDEARRDRRQGQEARARSLARAQAAVAAEAGKRKAQRHILDLGDRAVEVFSDRPGVWHLVTDGRPGPVLSPDDIPAMLGADQENKVRRGQAAGSGFLTVRQADEITSALDQGDPAAAIMLELSGPLGLSAIELERLVPGRAPGTCLSCRLPLSPRDGTEKCAWCLALASLPPRPRPVPLFPEEALAAWSCKCGCPTHRARQIHAGVRPALPRPSAVAAVRPLLAAGSCYWAAWHWPAPFSVIAALLAVVLFLSFISRVVRRAVR